MLPRTQTTTNGRRTNNRLLLRLQDVRERHHHVAAAATAIANAGALPQTASQRLAAVLSAGPWRLEITDDVGRI